MPSRHHRRSLPPLGLRLFLLRAGVVIDLNANASEVVAAAPSADAWACFEATGAAGRSLRRRREPRGWLTLREAGTLVGCDDETARAKLLMLDEHEADEHGTAVRRMGRWELVSAASLRRYVERFGGAVTEAVFNTALDAEHARRDIVRMSSAPPPLLSPPDLR